MSNLALCYLVAMRASTIRVAIHARVLHLPRSLVFLAGSAASGFPGFLMQGLHGLLMALLCSLPLHELLVMILPSYVFLAVQERLTHVFNI